MFSFDNLTYLDSHIAYLHKKLKNDNVFLVWGCIRDLLLWIAKAPYDIDVTLAWEPKEIYQKINKTGISHFMTEKFWTMTLIPKKQETEAHEEKIQYEITPFRQENDYKDKRHPEEIIWSDSLLDDAKRRDFTINCMYYFSHWKHSNSWSSEDIQTINSDTRLKTLKKEWWAYLPEYQLVILQKHELTDQVFAWGVYNSTPLEQLIPEENLSSLKILVDPYLGLQDIILWKLKAVGEADKRFQEDALRLIRALRIPNVINEKLQQHSKTTWAKVSLLDFETDTRNSIKKNFFLLPFIAKESIKEEMCKAFKKWNPFAFTSLLDETNILKYLLPSLYLCKHVEQPVRYHPFDVYAHTMLALYELQKINSNYLVRFAMLYHDVGKVDQFYAYQLNLTREEVREVMASWLNHQKSSVDLTKKDFQNLWFSNKEIDEIVRYIAQHHKPGEILDAKPINRKKKVRKLFSEAGFCKVNNLLDICIADRIGQYNPMQNSSDITDVEQLRILLKELQEEEWQFTPKDLAIRWGDIMKELNIDSGPQVGVLLGQAFDWVINDISQRNTSKEIFQYIKSLV